MAQPAITLLTDFGLLDGYVAAMKGVILGIAPEARLVDISHMVPPQDIRSAAFILFTSYAYFPPGTVHLAVVDPGVGTERRPIAVRTRSYFLAGPDNGLFSLILEKETGWEARTIENTDLFREPVSATFHGRDIFAPTAASLCLGRPFDTIGPVCSPFIAEWSTPVRTDGMIEGEIIHIDRFGNAITNIDREMAASGIQVRWKARIGGIPDLPVLDTYGRASKGSALALIGGSGFVEIAVNMGNAASELGLHTGMKVTLLDLSSK